MTKQRTVANGTAEQSPKFVDVTSAVGQLRMFYWYSDPSQKSHDVRGMVQAAASILYPAFKENVEAILPWTGLLKRGIVLEGVLRFMDQQRRNNFYFFQNCTAKAKNSSMAFIPFENLGTLELGGQSGNVGKEIYGAGECLWMYLMFEALGQASDRELMLLNLDLLDAFDAQQFPAHQLHFVLYNPTGVQRTAVITIPPAQGRKVGWSIDGKSSADDRHFRARNFTVDCGVLTSISTGRSHAALSEIAARPSRLFAREGGHA